MGVLDRWLKRFLDDSVQETPPPAAAQQARMPSPPLPIGDPPDPLDDTLRRVRARLTVDGNGRSFAESDELLVELRALDAGGRSKAADALLVDALLVTPSLALRRLLAERLLARGDRARAKSVLERLSQHDAHAVFALLALGEIAEADGDLDEARGCYERVLAVDVGSPQARARARRLRSDADNLKVDDGRRVLARFLGARAAGSRYAVVDEIGRGGAATVFRARDRIIGRKVALKIFHPRGAADVRRARLGHEARIAGGFDHPHIVPILDVDDTREMLVMALCDGGSLQRRIQQGRMRHTEAVELGAVLLRTLADIHAAGHVHLDVKPSNVLFHDGQLMLCDFGTAGLHELGAAAGTRAYMAPEQKSDGIGSPAADLYAAGLVVSESIEGRLTSSSALAAIPPGPRRRALQSVLGQLRAVDPRHRPSDGRVAAQRLLEAGAMPLTDGEGAALFHHVESLATREGGQALTRMRAHPLVAVLQAPAAQPPK
jgi:tRNA A-37 threonylcarbamoyl transferase component Bud32